MNQFYNIILFLVLSTYQAWLVTAYNLCYHKSYNNKIYESLRCNAFVRKNRASLLALKGSDFNNQGNDNVIGADVSGSLSQYFVPIFVGIWAVGYSLIFLTQMTYKLDDSVTVSARDTGVSGGILGVGLTVGLVILLVGFIVYEVFKPDSTNQR